MLTRQKRCLLNLGEHRVTIHRRIPCGDRQEHQIPWCASSGELHLVTTSISKKAQQRLYFLWRLRTAHLPPHILTMFYRGTIESVLSSCITAWFGNCTVSDDKTLQRIVRTAKKIIGVSLPFITDMYTTRCIRKANSIVDDPTHPSYTLLTLLPSGKSWVVDVARLFRSVVDVARLFCSVVDVARLFCSAVDVGWDPLALPLCPLASPCSSLPPTCFALLLTPSWFSPDPQPFRTFRHGC
ncbi:hypothetical protein QTP86_021864, partial [Hemibagrus guttatus]